MAALRQLYPSEENHFDFIAIPRKDKSDALDESQALVLARMKCMGVDWMGGMRLSAFNSGIRRSMEKNVISLDDLDAIQAGVTDAKQHLAVKESVWSSEGLKGWQGVKQDKCWTNLPQESFRVKETDKEGWWVADEHNRPLPFTETNYQLFMNAVSDVQQNLEAKIDSAGALLRLKPFRENLTKFHSFVGKVVRWELRETPNG